MARQPASCPDPLRRLARHPPAAHLRAILTANFCCCWDLVDKDSLPWKFIEYAQEGEDEKGEPLERDDWRGPRAPPLVLQAAMSVP